MGGGVARQSLSTSALQLRLKAHGRLVALIVIVICLLVLLNGASLLIYTPRALLGGLLMFIGLDLLDDWLIQGRHKFNRLDWSTVGLILVVIALTNFLVGIIVGLVVMMISFVFNSSRMRIFHRAMSGDEVISQVKRSLYHQRVLNEVGKQVYVLELQGFLFFGTANTLLEMIRRRVNEQPPLRYMVLDFKRVNNLQFVHHVQLFQSDLLITDARVSPCVLELKRKWSARTCPHRFTHRRRSW